MALIRTTAAGIKASHSACGALRSLSRHKRDRGAFEARKIVHIIIEGLEHSDGSVLQHLIQPTLGLTGKQRNAHCLCAIKVLIDAVEHADCARDMKTTNTNLDGSRP